VPGGLELVLPAVARDALLLAGHPRDFRGGEVVFHQGDPCDALFLLRVGRVAVRVSTPDGDEVTVGLLAAPEEFGEVGLIREDHHHTATVVALDDVRVVTVPASRFHDLRGDHPVLTDWLLAALARRLERTSALLADALFVEADRRVARRLLDCHDAFRLEPGQPLPLGQDDLAAMAGVARPTANRALRRLEDRGLVRLGRRHIVITDVDALAASAQ
jgi:CRP-like cAMP-binding protein